MPLTSILRVARGYSFRSETSAVRPYCSTVVLPYCRTAFVTNRLFFFGPLYGRRKIREKIGPCLRSEYVGKYMRLGHGLHDVGLHQKCTKSTSPACHNNNRCGAGCGLGCGAGIGLRCGAGMGFGLWGKRGVGRPGWGASNNWEGGWGKQGESCGVGLAGRQLGCVGSKQGVAWGVRQASKEMVGVGWGVRQASR